MVALSPPVCNFDEAAHDFSLPDTAGKVWSLQQSAGKNGLLVMFICNHCPYVKAILENLLADCQALQALDVGIVAIMSNDTEAYPEDNLGAMAALADRMQFSFPYLLDESQAVAQTFGAVCTPDFFGYNGDLKLQYRGRFDASGPRVVEPRAEKELLNAMTMIAETGQGPREQKASIGCSIKWR